MLVKQLSNENLEMVADFYGSPLYKLFREHFEDVLKQLKDMEWEIEEMIVEQINGSQKVIINKSIQEQRENLRGRKIMMDDFLSFIKEAKEKYDGVRNSRKKKRKSS